MKTISNTLKTIILIGLIITLSPGKSVMSQTNIFQRVGVAGFSIGSKGYIGTGFLGQLMYVKDFWEYNQITDVWTQKADFGGSPRYGCAGFSIGNMGYIGMGFDIYAFQKDLWQYDPVKNSWTRKTDFGGGKRFVPVCFSIGTKGYVGTGMASFMNGDSYDTKDFWEYDPGMGKTGKWTRKADFGGIERRGAVGFSIGTKGYLGTGIHFVSTSNNNNLNDFWEYNPGTNSWCQKANVGESGRSYAVGFGIGTKGYVGTGTGTGGLFNDFLEYDPVNNAWSQKATFTGMSRQFANGLTIGTKGYLGLGSPGSAPYLQDFWEYNQITNVWTRKTDFGSNPNGPLKEGEISEERYLDFNAELIVYPNPSNSTFNLRLKTTSEELVTVQIFNLTSKLVCEYNLLSPDEIMKIGDNLNAGIYTAVVTQGEYRRAVKLNKVQ